MNTKRIRSVTRVQNRYGWFFVGMTVLLVACFSLYPVISSFLMSFQTGKGAVYKFNGLGNFTRLFSDAVFKQALINTFIYFIFQVPVMTVLALLIAVILNNPDLKYRSFFRTAIFLPCVTSLVAYSVLFRSMFSSSGLINHVLMDFHIIANPIPWLMNAFWSKVLIILALTWRWTGYNVIFYLSALQNIGRSIYEAADIDGASGYKQFKHIVVPLLTPVILFTSVLSTIGTLQLFDESYNITVGGPGNATITLSHYIYNVLFKFTPNFGYASTISYVIVFFVAILTFIQFRLAGERHE